MTISSTSATVTLPGNGVTTSWPFTAAYDTPADIVVLFTDSTVNPPVVTQLTPNQYTLTPNAIPSNGLHFPGGTVVYPTSGSPILTNQSITIERVIAEVQTTSLLNQGAFNPSVVEFAMDRLCMMIQQLQAGIGTQGPAGPAGTAGIPQYVPISKVGGTGNAITLTPTPALGAYAEGVSYQFISPLGGNGVTVAVSGLPPRALLNPDGSALVYGQLVSGATATILDNGTNFVLVSQTVAGFNLLTPSINFNGVTTGITYGTRQLAVAKIGNFMEFAMILTVNSRGSAGSGVMNIVGFPWNANAIYVGAGVVPCLTSTIDFTGYTQLALSFTGGANVVNVAKLGTGNVANAYVTYADMVNGGTIWANGRIAL